MDLFLYHHEKGSAGEFHTKKELATQVAEAMKDNPDPYEVNREKPGYTHITGPTLILGDESCAGLRVGLSELGAGRCFMSGKKEVAEAGQTTDGFRNKLMQSVGLTMKLYSNAILQIGKYDILKTNDSAAEIHGRMQDIWKLLDEHNIKIHVCTIPSIEGATEEQEKRRQELNKLIKASDDPVFNVIDLEEAVKHVDTTAEDLVIDGKVRKKTPKTEKDKVAVAYLEALIGGGRDSFKEETDRHFAGPPKEVAYTLVGDSFARPAETSLEGAKKSPGHYVSGIDPQKPLEPLTLPAPGKTTEQMAERLETQIIPSLTRQPGYRCAVIQAGAEDVLAPLPSAAAADDAEKAIIKNLKRMYRRCLESNPPVMVVAVTLPPMSEYFDKYYQGEERARHYELWRKINDFIVKETFRLSQHPRDRYKRVMCVRAHDIIGTRMGYVREKFKDARGTLNEHGSKQMAIQIHKAINQMREGIDFGRKVLGNQWRGPDYFLDEHDYEPGK